MNAMDMVRQAISTSDEDMDTSEIIGFLNDAIAKINIECKATFPFMTVTDTSTEYPGFTETWQRTLLVPFAVGRIKQKESSQFEYSDSYREFSTNLLEFKASYKIPDEYKDTSSNTFTIEDLSSSPWGW